MARSRNLTKHPSYQKSKWQSYSSFATMPASDKSTTSATCCQSSDFPALIYLSLPLSLSFPLSLSLSLYVTLCFSLSFPHYALKLYSNSLYSSLSYPGCCLLSTSFYLFLVHTTSFSSSLSRSPLFLYLHLFCPYFPS